MKGKHRKDWNGSDLLEAGEYAYLPGHGWHACTPNGHLANLSMHDCSFFDGVLTVSPSIKVSGHKIENDVRVSDDVVELWHGYLEHGVWREC